jgi:hypothetical protein
MSPTDRIPSGGITHPDVLRSAFEGGPYGEHALYAQIDTVDRVAGAIPFVPLPVLAYLLIEGRFVNSAGDVAGVFRRAIYRNEETRAVELWLGGLDVIPGRRGGLRTFQNDGILVAAEHGVAMARLNAGRIGAWLWTEDFDLDTARLPGFGADGRGVGRGGETVVVPQGGDLPAVLLRSIILAAVRSGRIEVDEAAFLLDLGLRSPRAVRDRCDRELGKRLLIESRWPGANNLQAA